MKIFLIILMAAVVLASCGKTDEDKDNEVRILGTWYSTELNYLYMNDTVFFVFESGNEGKSKIKTYEDDFAWEIKRETLKTYYKKAPSYNIGYDQYNSKGVYKIESFEDNEIKVNQYFYNGSQKEATLFRY